MPVTVLKVLKKTDRYELREVMISGKTTPDVRRYDLQRHIYYQLEAPLILPQTCKIYQVPYLDEYRVEEKFRKARLVIFDREYQIPLDYEEFKELGGLCYETYSDVLEIDYKDIQRYHPEDKFEFLNLEGILEPYIKQDKEKEYEKANSKYPKY